MRAGASRHGARRGHGGSGRWWRRWRRPQRAWLARAARHRRRPPGATEGWGAQHRLCGAPSVAERVGGEERPAAATVADTLVATRLRRHAAVRAAPLNTTQPAPSPSHTRARSSVYARDATRDKAARCKHEWSLADVDVARAGEAEAAAMAKLLDAKRRVDPWLLNTVVKSDCVDRWVQEALLPGKDPPASAPHALSIVCSGGRVLSVAFTSEKVRRRWATALKSALRRGRDDRLRAATRAMSTRAAAAPTATPAALTAATASTTPTIAEAAGPTGAGVEEAASGAETAAEAEGGSVAASEQRSVAAASTASSVLHEEGAVLLGDDGDTEPLPIALPTTRDLVAGAAASARRSPAHLCLPNPGLAAVWQLLPQRASASPEELEAAVRSFCSAPGVASPLAPPVSKAIEGLARQCPGGRISAARAGLEWLIEHVSVHDLLLHWVAAASPRGSNQRDLVGYATELSEVSRFLSGCAANASPGRATDFALVSGGALSGKTTLASAVVRRTLAAPEDGPGKRASPPPPPSVSVERGSAAAAAALGAAAIRPDSYPATQTDGPDGPSGELRAAFDRVYRADVSSCDDVESVEARLCLAVGALTMQTGRASARLALASWASTLVAGWRVLLVVDGADMRSHGAGGDSAGAEVVEDTGLLAALAAVFANCGDKLAMLVCGRSFDPAQASRVPGVTARHWELTGLGSVEDLQALVPTGTSYDVSTAPSIALARPGVIPLLARAGDGAREASEEGDDVDQIRRHAARSAVASLPPRQRSALRRMLPFARFGVAFDLHAALAAAGDVVQVFAVDVDANDGSGPVATTTSRLRACARLLAPLVEANILVAAVGDGQSHVARYVFNTSFSSDELLDSFADTSVSGPMMLTAAAYQGSGTTGDSAARGAEPEDVRVAAHFASRFLLAASLAPEPAAAVMLIDGEGIRGAFVQLLARQSAPAAGGAEGDEDAHMRVRRHSEAILQALRPLVVAMGAGPEVRQLLDHAGVSLEVQRRFFWAALHQLSESEAEAAVDGSLSKEALAFVPVGDWDVTIARGGLKAQLSWVCLQLARVDEAALLAEEALEVLKSCRSGHGAALRGTAFNAAGAISFRVGDDADAHALKLLVRATQLRRTALGAAHPRATASLVNVGNVLRHQGRLRAAERVYRAALEAFDAYASANGTAEGSTGPHAGEYGAALCSIGLVLDSRGDHATAERAFAEALTVCINAGGRVSLPTAHVMVCMAEHLWSCGGDDSEVESLFAQAAAVRNRLLGQQHPLVASTHFNHGVVLRAVGRMDDAAGAFDQAAAGFALGGRGFEDVRAQRSRRAAAECRASASS